MLFVDIDLKYVHEDNKVKECITNVRVESKPALTEKILQEKIAASAKALDFTYQFMQSGAGHDSQEMALIAPVAMIFVPSVGGISHSPKEFTKSMIWLTERKYY